MHHYNDDTDMMQFEQSTFTAWLESSPLFTVNNTPQSHMEDDLFRDWSRSNGSSSSMLSTIRQYSIESSNLDMRLDSNIEEMFSSVLLDSPCLQSNEQYYPELNYSMFGNQNQQAQNGYMFETQNHVGEEFMMTDSPTSLSLPGSVPLPQLSGPRFARSFSDGIIESNHESKEWMKEDISDGGVLFASVKSEPGSSCHQCKRRRPPSQLRQCRKCFESKTGVGKRSCRKRFCIHCLSKYNLRVDPVDPSFHCPSCVGKCACASCDRKRKNRNNNN